MILVEAAARPGGGDAPVVAEQGSSGRGGDGAKLGGPRVIETGGEMQQLQPGRVAGAIAAHRELRLWPAPLDPLQARLKALVREVDVRGVAELDAGLPHGLQRVQSAPQRSRAEPRAGHRIGRVLRQVVVGDAADDVGGEVRHRIRRALRSTARRVPALEPRHRAGAGHPALRRVAHPGRPPAVCTTLGAKLGDQLVARPREVHGDGVEEHAHRTAVLHGHGVESRSQARGKPAVRRILEAAARVHQRDAHGRRRAACRQGVRDAGIRGSCPCRVVEARRGRAAPARRATRSAVHEDGDCDTFDGERLEILRERHQRGLPRHDDAPRPFEQRRAPLRPDDRRRRCSGLRRDSRHVEPRQLDRLQRSAPGPVAGDLELLHLAGHPVLVGQRDPDATALGANDDAVDAPVEVLRLAARGRREQPRLERELVDIEPRARRERVGEIRSGVGDEGRRVVCQTVRRDDRHAARDRREAPRPPREQVYRPGARR